MTTAMFQSTSLDRESISRAAKPAMIAAASVIILAIVVTFAFRASWQLLGVGRGFVPPDLYHYTGLLVLLGTTFGQFVGWAAGSALFAHVWQMVTRRPIDLRTIQISTTVVYLGLAAVPLFFFHVLFGGPLAGIPHEGLVEWLRENHASAYWLLIVGHPIVDWSLVPLGIATLAMIWWYPEQTLQSSRLQFLFLLSVILTSFMVALSLSIHSTLVHIRIGT